MPNSYAWTFEPIEVSAAEIDGLEDVIKNIHWRLTAVSDDETPLTAAAYGAVALDDPGNAEDFIEFNSVSKDQVKAWVLEKISSEKGQDIAEADLIAALDAQIAEQQAPKLVGKVPASWAS